MECWRQVGRLRSEQMDLHFLVHCSKEEKRSASQKVFEGCSLLVGLSVRSLVNLIYNLCSLLVLWVKVAIFAVVGRVQAMLLLRSLDMK